jgi:hypothetical protein
MLLQVQRYNVNIRQTFWLALLFFINANSQVIQWSNPTKLKGGAVFTKVIAENKDGIFLLRYRNRFYSKSVVLERYSHLLTLELTKTIDLKNARLIKLYALKNNFMLVRSSYNRFNQTNQLIAQFYSYDFKTRGKEIILAEAKVLEYGDRGNFRLRISDNQHYISVLYSEPSKQNNIIINHQLYTNTLQKVSQKITEFPANYMDFIIQDFDVNNKGEMVMLCNQIEAKRRTVIEDKHSIFVFVKDSIRDFIISDSIVLKSSKLVYDRTLDRSKVVAFYGYKNAPGIEGTLFFELNESLTKSTLSLNGFSEKLIADVNINDRNKGMVSEGFSILEVVPRSDGGMLLIAEQKEIATEDDIVLVNGIPQSTSKNIYNFNELLVLNYDSSGFIDWHNVITKNQTTINDGGYFSSAVVFVGEKFVQLIFNDQLRSTGDVMQYTIYNNGVVQSNKLLKNELENVVIIPVESKQVSSNKVIIPTSKNRRFALLKIIYD